MTDITNLTYKELQQLEKQIEQRKETLRKSKDCVEGYKITFCVKFNPAKHEWELVTKYNIGKKPDQNY